MSDGSGAAEPSCCPEPLQVRWTVGADIQDRAARLLILVRILIDYGTQLAHTLQQRVTPINLTDAVLHFGTVDIPLILSRITRGLHLAAALQTRLEQRLAHPPAAPASVIAPTSRQPRAASLEEPDAGAADPRLARMPTPAHIAAQLRRRPIGAVLADICRDLGILPSDPIWHELSSAILQNDGNLAALIIDTMDRADSGLADFLAMENPPKPSHGQPFGLSFGTGPP